MLDFGMPEIRCAALLFDMDGVLIDSMPAVARVWSSWALEHGFDPEEVVRAAHGRPSLLTVRDYLPNADHLAENHEVERREIADTEGIVPLPGAMALLEALPRGRWAIVTSCTRPLAEVRWRAAGLPHPGAFITSNDIEHGKPAPDPYRRAAQALRFAPADCVVVEDAPAGIRSGKAAGAQVIGMTTMTSGEELREAGADWIVENCTDLDLAPRADGTNKLRIALRDGG
jgi:mannitol-1-/sugar-/sorbitol-6-phosphatase